MPQAASRENRQSKAKADLVAMSTPARVLEALLNQKISIEWVVERLKEYTEKGATPVQLTCLKMIIELMSNGGLISRTTLMAYQRLGASRRLSKDKPTDDSTDADLDDGMPTMDIDAIVSESLAERRKSYGEEDEKAPGGIDGSAAAGAAPRIPAE